MNNYETQQKGEARRFDYLSFSHGGDSWRNLFVEPAKRIGRKCIERIIPIDGNAWRVF